jgi:hypothetical protein
LTTLRLLLSILLIPSLLMAEETVMPALAQDRSLPAVSLLPVGSILTKVLIPRYDRNKKLTAVLRSEEMEVVDNQTVKGKGVRLEFYHPDRTQRARIDLETASFDQKKGILESRKPVDIVSTDFTARGSGLTYAQKQSQGFLIGPVQTRFFAKPASK